jgi:hypothetical protein
MANGAEGPAEGEPNWTVLISEATRSRTIAGRRHDGGLTTATRPQKIVCEDEALYAVKLSQNGHGDGRGIFSEQVVGRLGQLIMAPTAEVILINVPADLIEEIRATEGDNLGFVPEPGVHHGSRWALGFSDRQHLAYVDENRPAFAALCVLYSWVFCNGDHQWIYRNAPPHDVLSVDHTTFLPGGPDWTSATLRDGEAAVIADTQFAAVGLTPAEHAASLGRLSALTELQLAEVLAAPPDTWGVGLLDREAVASYLWNRRQRVADVLGG